MLQLINFKLSDCIFCFLCYLFLTIDLFAFNEIIKDSEHYIGQHIVMRGFLYKDLEGNLVLRSEPGLKSCCVNRDGRQINIRSQEKIETSLNAIALEGIFNIDHSGKFVLDN